MKQLMNAYGVDAEHLIVVLTSWTSTPVPCA
ncbi:MAG: hypothetical protein ACLSVD_03630 [Eggerthellaceae bacterium]